MTPAQLKKTLQLLIEHQLRLSVMIWGPPGVGKSSIVAQVAQQAEVDCIDVRLSQLAPTDLRGLPVADAGISRWYPPEFLPRKGNGILFMDEINMAPPAMQGMAQQLILDRKVGNYEVPAGWYIWAAGNRKEDRAAVFDMPAPLSNRFVHLETGPDFDSFRAYALRQEFHEQVVAFLSYRPALLHKINPNDPRWPSPRSWEMASQLHKVGMDISISVGDGPAAEFRAFCALYEKMPDVEAILSGNSKPRFPQEPSMRYGMVLALTARAKEGDQALNALRYLSEEAPAEWVQLYAADAIPLLRRSGKLAQLSKLLKEEPALKDFMTRFRDLMGMSR